MARRDRLVRQMLRQRFLVTLGSGETFDGLLMDADETVIVLADAWSLSTDGSRIKVDTSLYLPRWGVIYMQVSPGGHR